MAHRSHYLSNIAPGAPIPIRGAPMPSNAPPPAPLPMVGPPAPAPMRALIPQPAAIPAPIPARISEAKQNPDVSMIPRCSPTNVSPTYLTKAHRMGSLLTVPSPVDRPVRPKYGYGREQQATVEAFHWKPAAISEPKMLQPVIQNNTEKQVNGSDPFPLCTFLRSNYKILQDLIRFNKAQKQWRPPLPLPPPFPNVQRPPILVPSGPAPIPPTFGAPAPAPAPIHAPILGAIDGAPIPTAPIPSAAPIPTAAPIPGVAPIPPFPPVPRVAPIPMTAPIPKRAQTVEVFPTVVAHGRWWEFEKHDILRNAMNMYQERMIGMESVEYHKM